MLVTTVFIFHVILTTRGLDISSGRDRFYELRHSSYFVDKTMFIKEFFRWQNPLVIAAPDGFGKTFNLEMTRSFLSKDANKSYIRDVFRGTRISQEEHFVDTELGEHAVLYCSFRHGEQVVDYVSIVAAFRSIVYRTFALHPYLMKSKQLTRYDKRKLTSYTGVKKHLKLTPAQISIGLHFLSKMLRKHHQKDVVLLIDDYDAVLLDSLFTKEINYDMVLGFHNSLLSAVLHRNEYINRTILLGVTCTCVQSLAQPLRELRCVRSLEDANIAPFFGLTDPELDHLLDSSFARMRHRRTDIRSWYGGYVSSDLKTHVFHIGSTLKFLNSTELRSYWPSTRAIKTLKYLLIEPNVEKLLNESMLYKSMTIEVERSVDTKYMHMLKSFTDNELWDTQYADQFIYLLLEIGYFAFTKESGAHKTGHATVKIPNEEIRSVFEHIYKTFLADSQELLDRLKEAVHDLTFTEKQDTELEVTEKDILNYVILPETKL